MHGFSEDLKLEGVVGSEIHQICLGRYDVQFLFYSGTEFAFKVWLRCLRARS